MPRTNIKTIGKSEKYKYVYIVHKDGKTWYSPKISIKGRKLNYFYVSEREAALAVDKFLIDNFKQPVNILKPLNNNTTKKPT